jgi:hypothetical protein
MFSTVSFILGMLVALEGAAGPGAAQGGGPGQKRGMLGMRFSPAQVRGGQITRLQLLLNHPAPSGGMPVKITNSDPGALPLPSTLLVPAGARRMGVTITTRPVKSRTIVTVTGADGNKVRGASVVILP